MPYHYSDPRRESDPHALPNIETFCERTRDCADCGIRNPANHHRCAPNRSARIIVTEAWYWQACFPGCLPDGDPIGPFASEAAALAEARESAGLCEHGTADDERCDECSAPELWAISDGGGRFLHYFYGSLNGGSCSAWASEVAAQRTADALVRAGLLAEGWRVVRLSDDDARAWGNDDAEGR